MDPVTKQTFALKHVIREDVKDLRFVEQMENEFAISRLFNHPNLRRSYDLKIVKKMIVKVTEAFLVMELFNARRWMCICRLRWWISWIASCRRRRGSRPCM